MTRGVASACSALCCSGGRSCRPPPRRASWPSEGPPRPLAARDVKFPPYQIRTLPNGLQVVAVLHHEQPVVSMRMIVRAGGALDPKDKLGLADLTAVAADAGDGRRSRRPS